MSSWLSSIWPSSSSQPSQSTPPSLPPQTPSAPPFTPTPPTPAEPSAPPPPPPTSLTAEEQGAFASWRNSLADFTGMGASSSDDPARTQERREWQSCEKMKQDALQNDPQIVFLLKHLKLEGCPTTEASVHCAPCDEQSAGGFSANHGILLCQNRTFNKNHFVDTLSHELIHLYDTCKFDVDFSNLRHHACTEIRAANLSGDCTWASEFKRGHYSMANAQSKCVRRRAILSVEGNPHCSSRDEATKAVDEVWASCKADTRPFDQVHKL